MRKEYTSSGENGDMSQCLGGWFFVALRSRHFTNYHPSPLVINPTYIMDGSIRPLWHTGPSVKGIGVKSHRSGQYVILPRVVAPHCSYGCLTQPSWKALLVKKSNYNDCITTHQNPSLDKNPNPHPTFDNLHHIYVHINTIFSPSTRCNLPPYIDLPKNYSLRIDFWYSRKKENGPLFLRLSPPPHSFSAPKILFSQSTHPHPSHFLPQSTPFLPTDIPPQITTITQPLKNTNIHSFIHPSIHPSLHPPISIHYHAHITTPLTFTKLLTDRTHKMSKSIRLIVALFAIVACATMPQR